ncbi:hypothetical protein MKX01_035495 [Papaver californicum]|nr:hypothetical protein MKX01_035495 [Papaver californicum]
MGRRMIKLRNLYIRDTEQAAEDELQTKSQLTQLRLDFGFCEETLASTSTNGQIHQQSSESEKLMESVLESKHIGVEIYGGGGQYATEVAFPKLIALEIHDAKNLEVWEFGNGEVQMMPRVTSIKLWECDSLIALPALNKLPSLETLNIQAVDQLTSISVELYTMSSRGSTKQLNNFTSFPKLASLRICGMKCLETIVLGVITEGEKGDTNNEIAIMPCLRRLTLLECQEMKSLRSLPSMEKFYFLNLREEEEGNLSLLPCILDIYFFYCPKFISFPCCLPSLRSLHTEGKCEDGHLPISPNLTTLHIENHPSLVLEDVARFKELQELTLYGDLDKSFKFIPDFNRKKIDPLTYSASSSSNQISLLHPVTVRWQEELLEVGIDPSQPPSVSKSELYGLTGVPPERQEITINGGFLKVQTLMMTGTADEIV